LRLGCRDTLARVRRAGILAAGVVGVLAIAGIWLAFFRDTAEPVTVGEAVTSFRTETETPAAATPIPPGVYVYATRGYETTDALTGVTHRYPGRSTITVTAADCGVNLMWRVLKGRSTEWTFCVTGDGWELRAQDERHTFFGRTEATTYTCEDTPIRPVGTAVRSWPVSCTTGDGWELRTQDERHTFFGRTEATTYTCEDTPIRPVGTAVRSWPVSCTTGDAAATGIAKVVPGAVLRVGDTLFPVRHVSKVTAFTGSIRGSSRYDFWFHVGDRLPPVRIVMISHTTNDSPVGDVHYEEDVTLVLTSLKPRR
jgi:hypothetical protein